MANKSTKQYKVILLGGISELKGKRYILTESKKGIIIRKTFFTKIIDEYIIEWDQVINFEKDIVNKSKIKDQEGASFLEISTPKALTVGSGLSVENDIQILEVHFYDNYGSKIKAIFKTKEAKEIISYLNKRKKYYLS